MDNIRLLYIDLFCGAGGTSTGVENAAVNGKKCAKVIACVNHDANAIASHAANHPDALHFTEDIRTLELSPLVAHAERMRILHPDARLVLWASLECTNFSKAKGGMPRDADSRTLAEHLFRYIEALHPDYIQIENVEEFMSWGDMDENGHPISKDKGKSYVRWVNNVCKYGYYFDWKILNAADYGAYTSRKRFFGQFAMYGLPIAFPEATQNRLGVAKVQFLSKQFGGDPSGKNISVNEPAGTITCRDHHAFVSAHYGNGYNTSIDAPMPTLTCVGRFGLVTNNFLEMQYGNGTPASINEPSPTVTTNPKHNLVSVKPCFTLINRMDKIPPYLVSTKEGLAIEVYETDSPATIKIKEFMALYGISDIRMRMLRIPELKRIMGFPKDYTLIGTQAEQKKFIGNAVEVNMARVLCEALCIKLIKF